MKPGPADAVLLKVLRRLSPGGARLARADDAWRLFRDGVASMTVEREAGDVLARRGLIAEEGEGRWRLSAAGAAWLRRALAGGDDAFAAQHQERVTSVVSDGGERLSVLVNQDESPLAWLRRRRDSSGKPMLMRLPSLPASGCAPISRARN